jgi:hypothetical protein
MLLSNATIILAMQNDKGLKKSLEKFLESTYPEQPNFSDFLNTDILNELSTSDHNLQCNAYAAAIYCNDVTALEKLEKAQIPVPNEDNLGFMMQYYALDRKPEEPSRIDLGLYQKNWPKEPKVQAFRWCLLHNANPNKNWALSYKPLDYFGGGKFKNQSLHPLRHIAAYSLTPECLQLLPLMRKRGASISPEFISVECTELINQALEAPIHALPNSDEDEIKMARIMAILQAYKGVILNQPTTQTIKALIASKTSLGRKTAEQVTSLNEELELHTAAGIRNRRAAAYLKSLFNCGKHSEYIHQEDSK